MEVVRQGGRHGGSKGGVGDMEVVRKVGRHGGSKGGVGDMEVVREGWETWRW